MSTIGIVGAGSWGSAIAKVLTDNKHEVSIYSTSETIAEEIRLMGTNRRYLKNLVYNTKPYATTNAGEAISDKEFIVFAIPSQNVRLSAREIKPYISKDALLINASKGIEVESLSTISKVLEEELPKHNSTILSGPSHAEEVAVNMPTSIVSAGTTMKDALRVQELFMNEYFRVYTNEDYLGVELGGALKNVISLAIGVLEGLGYGDNTKAAVMTRGIVEIARLGAKLGGQEETFSGLSGIGDLIATATSSHSRNRQAGLLLGRGYSLNETLREIGMVVEGIETTKAAYRLSQAMHVEMPITAELYHILFEGGNVASSALRLMSRKEKSE